MRKIVLLLTVSIILAGCTSPRQLALFTSKSSTMTIGQSNAFVIAPDDRLDITFTAVNSEAVAPYNSAGSMYVVRENGTVTIPVLGEVQLAGKNTEEAIQYLEELVQNQVKNPIVRLSFTNAAVTILGEVARPSRLAITEPMALPQAIGAVGGFTKNARLNDVLVQRTNNGHIVQYRVNLLTDQLFSSPAYYLQKGDVVNISPLHVQ